MEAARAWGVSPSVLLGRAVAPGEPAWTQEDTDLAQALLEVEAETCPGCGHSRAESMDMATEFEWEAEPVKCHACAAMDRAAANYGRDATWNAAGVRWVTRRR